MERALSLLPSISPSLNLSITLFFLDESYSGQHRPQ